MDGYYPKRSWWCKFQWRSKKYIYIYEKINQADNHEKEWMDNLPQNAEDFYENEWNSPSSGYCQNDELTENRCGDLSVWF